MAKALVDLFFETSAEPFLKIVNMSISASYLVLLVVALRLLLKKAPKWINVLLWGLVAVRLLCPFTLESALSLIPSAQTVSPEILLSPSPTIDSGIEAVNRVVNPIITESFTPNPVASANPLQILIPMAALVWCMGMLLMGLYTLVSYWRLRHRVRMAVRMQDTIYRSECISSPFVLGLFRPRIYLPCHMAELDIYHVIAHERTHIRRRDHWWKPLGFLLLTIHWFNPLMWLAYILLCRDIELACDEKVVKDMRPDQRANYSQALLNCSVNRRSIAACPLAFGEVGVKERVKNVLNYKKPAFWAIMAALIIVTAVAVCFLTNPKEELPFMKEMTPVLSVEVFDHRSGETIRRSLYEAEREELAYRLRDLKGIRKYQTPTEFTPAYEMTAQLEGLGTVHIYCVSAEQQDILLEYEKIDYRVNDPDFAQYLDTVCAGKDIFALPGSSDAQALAGLSLCITDILYDDPRLSSTWSFDRNVPYCTVDQNLHLLTRDGHPSLPGGEETPWIDCGGLESVELAEENFDRLFYDYDASALRRENRQAWRVVYSEESGDVLLYLLQQNNGELYLAYGGNSTIRWLLKLETVQEQDASAPGISMTIEERTAATLTLRFHQTDPDAQWYFLNPYKLQTKVDGIWTDMELSPEMQNATWPDTAEPIHPDGELHIAWEWYYGPLSDGDYRICLDVTNSREYTDQNTYTIYAEFGYIPLGTATETVPRKDLPENYSMEEAVIDKCVVLVDGDVRYNSDVWEAFAVKCSREEPATVRVMTYYNLPSPEHYDPAYYETIKDSYPITRIQDLDFDGTSYILRWLEDGQTMVKRYQYLLYFDGIETDPNVSYDVYKRYVLTNDIASYEEMQSSLLSSQSGAAIDHYEIYTDLIYYIDHLEIPALNKATLELDGQVLLTITDTSALSAIQERFANAEALGYEPKTYSLGPELVLIGKDGTEVVIELGLDSDLCKVDETFFDYGPGYTNEGSTNAIPKLFELLGISDWPEAVYEKYPYLRG